MKKLFIILALAFVGCSTEEIQKEPEQEPVVITYLAYLQEECMKGEKKEIPVSEKVYYGLYTNHEINDCEEYHWFPDVNTEEWKEGYLAGLRSNDPQYPKYPLK